MLIRAGTFIRMRAFRQKKIQLSSFISSKDMDFISDNWEIFSKSYRSKIEMNGIYTLLCKKNIYIYNNVLLCTESIILIHELN